MVVPPRGREYVLRELHGGYPGVVRMKGMARMFVWWPGIDKAVEEMVESCVQCQSCRSSPQVAPLQPWAWPTRPWVRLHIDYAGPLLGRMLLVVVDAHSKWIEAEVVEVATSECPIRKLRAMFARYGLPEPIVSDNGACFTSREFTEFLKSNCIRHITTAPYHPASNGLAKRAVKIVQDGLKKLGTGELREKFYSSIADHTAIHDWTVTRRASVRQKTTVALGCFAPMLLRELNGTRGSKEEP